MPKTSTFEFLDHIRRLRRVERRADASLRDDIADVREFLERKVGPTIRPADAARLLGVSHPALKRWIDKGEIASVLTPAGRREIPLPELVGLLDEVDKAREAGQSRALASVIKDRRRRSEETIDLDRLLPRPRGRTHRGAEMQGLAYHRAVAERLDRDLVEEARRRLRRWRREGQLDARWADEWEKLLSQPASQIAKIISSDSKHGRALRQTSPFAGALTEQERRRLVKAVEERAER